MYPRVVTRRHKGKVYRSLHIVESVRSEGRVRQRMLANLGSLDDISAQDAENLIRGFGRILGRPQPAPSDQGPAPSVRFESSKAFGDVYILRGLWAEVGLAAMLERRAQRSDHEFDVARHVELMVLNRAIDPCSKLSLLEWLETVHVPGIDAHKIEYHHLLRAMDWLLEHKEDLEAELANRVLHLFDQKLDLVFWDVSSTYFETDRAGSFRTHGYSRDHRPDRPQVVFGVVMTRDGFPVHHEVFAGDTADVSTLSTAAEALGQRFNLGHVVFVGDRGMLSEANRAALAERGYGYILAHRLRQRNDFKVIYEEHRKHFERWDRLTDERVKLLDAIDRGEVSSDEEIPAPKREHLEVRLKVGADGETDAPMSRRVVVSYDQDVAADTRRGRLQRLGRATQELKELDHKLLQQDRGESRRGRPLSDPGALLRAAEVLRHHRVRGLVDIDIDPDDGIFCHSDDEEAQAWEDRIDGVLVIETTLTMRQASAAEVERQYRNLQDLERCFRTMKSSLMLRPVFHSAQRRIRAHIFICVLALLLMRIMRARLGPATEKRDGRRVRIGLSPERALDTMARLQRVTARVGTEVISGLTTTTPEQRALLRQLQLPFPDRRTTEM